ncbi:hypothetical protein BGZ81_009693 [Podila clonocystis]|nr:hypothetical protein BGZ81_009693 [Podila clonocystis]
MACITLAGCSRKPAMPAPPPPEVSVVAVKTHSIPMTTELPGRTSPYLAAEVRARVDGIVLQRNFVEGSEVKAGQLLYTIDPAVYQAQLQSANAALAKADANLKAAAAQRVRQQDYDNAVAQQNQAAAEVASARAMVNSAKINLGYTKVVSPIAGRVGRSQVTKGAYVQAAQATLLCTVQKVDPMYVDVTQSSADLLRLRREMASAQSTKAQQMKVDLILEDGTPYSVPGKLEFSDITVDQSTGAIALRAIFQNSKQELLPGMFVRARIHERFNRELIVVPQVGVTHNAKGQPTVLVVGAGDVVEQRTLVTLKTMEDQWVVLEGLNAGDRVIVQGLQKILLKCKCKINCNSLYRFYLLKYNNKA